MEVKYVPLSEIDNLMDSINPVVIGENNLQNPVTLEQIDKIYHLLQLQALRIDELENRIRTLEEKS